MNESLFQKRVDFMITCTESFIKKCSAQNELSLNYTAFKYMLDLQYRPMFGIGGRVPAAKDKELKNW